SYVLALAWTACDMNIPDLNNPGVGDLVTHPTPTLVSASATGLIIGDRAGFGDTNGYVMELGILGREAYNLDTADPRFVSELLASPALDPGTGTFGGNFWALPYANIRNANLLLHALDVVMGMTDAQKEATRGFAETLQA